MKRNGTIRTTIHALKFCKKNLGKYIGADHNRWITNVAVVMSQALKRQTLVGLGLGQGLSPLLKAGPQARPGGFSGLGPLSINPKKYYFHPNF